MQFHPIQHVKYSKKERRGMKRGQKGGCEVFSEGQNSNISEKLLRELRMPWLRIIDVC